RIVVVWGNNQKTHRTREPVSVPDLIDFREQSSLVEQIASFVYDDFSLSIGAEPERIQGTMVSANFFNVLGVKPALGRVPGVKPAFGRLFVEGEDASSSGRSVVLSNKLWKERFGSDPSIVEKTIQLTVPRSLWSESPLPSFNRRKKEMSCGCQWRLTEL